MSSRSAVLLASVSTAVLILLLGTARADETIDVGTTVTVPGTQASPWIVDGDLGVDGSLTVANGGVVIVNGRLGVGGSLTIANGGVVRGESLLGVQISGTLILSGTPGAQGVLETSVVLGGQLILDGGILREADTRAFGSILSASTTIGNGGAFIDTNNNALAPNSPLTGSGGLTKLGSGSLTLFGSNTYAGPTAVTGGTVQSPSELVFTQFSSAPPTSGGSAGVNLTVGLASGDVAKFQIDSGATFTASLTAIGAAAGSSGTVTLFLSGSRLDSNIVLVGANGTGSLVIGAGTTVAGAGDGIIGDFSGSSGTATVSGSWTANTLAIGGEGTGALTITNGGSVTASGGVVVAQVVGSVGALNIGAAPGNPAADPGTLNAASVAFGAGSGTLNFNHTSTNYVFTPQITGNGMVNALAGTTIFTADNTYTGGTTISGGVLQLGNGGATGSIVGNVNNDGTLAFNRSNAVAFGGAIGGAGSVQQVGGGTTTLSGANSYTGGTTVEAGTLRSGASGAFVNNTAYTVNGGTLDLNGLGLVMSSLSGTGGAVALGGAALSVDQAGNTGYAGAIIGSGSLTKTGIGILTLTGASTFVGGTTISGGTLRLNGTLAGPLAVNAGATLGGTGTIGGDVTVASNGILAPGASPGTLSIGGNLALSAGSILNFELGTPNNLANGVSDRVDVTGNLKLDGTLNVADAGGFGVGLYRLFNYGGTLSGNGLAVGTTPPGTTPGDLFVQTGIAGQVNLVNTAGTTLSFWDGNGVAHLNNNQVDGGSGTWSVANGNWTDQSGALNASMTPQPGFAVFAGTAGTVTVDNSAGAVAITGMQFAVDGYRIGGDAITLADPQTTVRVGDGTAAGAGYHATISSALTGSGGLVKTDLGTLLLTAANTYTDGTTIDGGTLQIGNGGTTGSITGDVTNNAVLAFNRSNVYQFDGAVSGSGSLQQNGTGTTILTAANTYTGGTTISAGALSLGNGGTSGSIVGDVTNNAILAFDRSNAYQFDGVISGTGALQQVGSGRTTLTAVSTYTGATTINGGTLRVNGDVSASSLITVNAGGTLGGNGIVGNTTINGGTLAPGNSIGLLTVRGSLVFTAASSYMVEVSPDSADRTNVTRTATLGGATVNASFAAGTYVARQYTILHAEDRVTGTFGTEVNTNLPTNFHTALSYDGNNAYLNLILNFAVPSGLTGNQQSVGNALTDFFNSSGGIPLVFGSLTRAGLSQASGEIAVGSQQATFDAMTQFMGVMTDPFVAGRGDPVSASSGAPQFAEGSDSASAYAANGKPRTRSERDAYAAIYRKAPPMAASFAQRWSVWAAGYGGSQTTDGHAGVGSNTATSRIYGTAVGADYRFSPSTLAGFALAGGGTNFSIANGLGSGRSDLFQAGAFLRHTVGPAYISAALAYGWQDITTDRTITIAGVDQLRAKFNANAFSSRVEGGYRFVTPWMGGVGITPYAAGQFTTFDLPAYAEQVLSGANTFALGYAAKSVADTRSELGIRTDKSFAMQDLILTLRGRVAWAHDFNTDRNIAATFQTLPGASFVVNGAAQASDSALTTASAELKWRNGFSFVATFEGEFSEVTRSYVGKGVVRYAW